MHLYCFLSENFSAVEIFVAISTISWTFIYISIWKMISSIAEMTAASVSIAKNPHSYVKLCTKLFGE